MFAGYAFGRVTERTPESRRNIYLLLGATLTGLFIALRVIGVYGDPRAWDRHSLFGFLNTTKYPASLEYLLMTLGPMFIVWGLAEHWKGGGLVSVIETFGRVPMFFYLLHIPLIHAAACIVSIVREGHVDPWLFANHPLIPGPAPAGYMWSLGLLYSVYATCIVVLYFPCKWFARMKQASRSMWLKFM
jgi:hypothetical protein